MTTGHPPPDLKGHR